MCTSAIAVGRAPFGAATDALVVTPAAVEHVAALIDGGDHFERAFGIRVVPGYLEFEGVLPHSLEQITIAGVDPRWLTHLFIHEADYALIGLGGFKGAPVDGRVEIGYGIAPSYRHRGLATTAAAALVQIARDRGATTVVAHTLAEPSASTSVLRKLAFARREELDGGDARAMWCWELDVAA